MNSWKGEFLMTNTKKKHGNKMKLMSAIGMLTVSAAMLVSSTFAWFSMNKTVTASTSQIQATAANPYLLISETENGTFDEAADAMVLDPTADTQLKLVTPLNVASNVAYKATASASQTTTPSTFTTADTVLWGTTTSTNPAEVQASNVTTLVAADDLDEYVQVSELWFKVKDNGANTVAGTNLKCTKITFSDGTNTIAASGRVLMVGDSGRYQLFNLVDGEVTASTSHSTTDALYDTVTTTAEKVTVYFYFDGTAATSYTNIATDLSSVSATYEFSVDNQDNI